MKEIISKLYIEFKALGVSLKDKIVFFSKFLVFKRDKEYGFTKELVEVDQLGNANPEKVEGVYGAILDLKAAKEFGTDNLEEYAFWGWRSCGVANVATILKTFDKFDGKLFDLVSDLKNSDGYLFQDKYGNKDVGWKHSALVDALSKRGIAASLLKRVSPDRVLLEVLNGHMVIASVKSVLKAGGSHMIIVKSFKKSSHGLTLQIYNPYNLNGLGGSTTIAYKEFKKIFLNNGITFHYSY